METTKLQRGPPLEIEGTRTKGGGSHSYSGEPARDEAAEDGELRPREEEEETLLRADETQQVWVDLRYHQVVRGQTTQETVTATIAGARATGQTSVQNWQKNSKLSST